MDLEEIGISAGNWVDSAQDRDYWRALVNATLNFQQPQTKDYTTSVNMFPILLLRIFGPKRDENGEWRRLHNEELHSLYRSI